MDGSGRAQVDPITAQVLHGALESIAIEMGHKLCRMSHSTIIRESEDFGAALLDAEGRQLCESVFSTPLQLGPIPGYVRGVRQLFAARGDTFEPGDVIIHNSPYHGASHGPDIGIVVPVFHDGRLIGFSATTAHHLDIGSCAPGSCGIVDAVDAYAEGLQFKAIKCYEAGRRNVWFWRMLADNVRASQWVIPDLEAQVAAARLGAERYVELVGKYGIDTVVAAGEYMMDYSERMMRQEIEKLPDGSYHAEGFVDGFLDSPDPRRKDLKIAVTIDIRGSDLYVDFTGTSPQVDDRPINLPWEGTTDVAVYLTLRSILLDTARFEYVPQNSGLTRPIHLSAPEGTLVRPIFPAPTIARFCAGNMVADTVMKALAPICPDKVCAGVANSRVIAYNGISNGQHWVYMDITEGAYGGRFGKDGIDAVDCLYANTRNNPIEDIESHLPLRVLRYELREDAMGAGKWRGGTGTIRAIQMINGGRMALEGDGHKYHPWGFRGGLDGEPGKLVLNPGPNEQYLPSKIPDRVVAPGEVFQTVSPCGGGYGDPLERDVQRVLDDVLDEYISLQTAREKYGVVIRPDTLTVDEAATEILRAEMAKRRRA